MGESTRRTAFYTVSRENIQDRNDFSSMTTTPRTFTGIVDAVWEPADPSVLRASIAR